MANLEIEFREHPARAAHPVTGRPLDMVHPAVKDWKAVYLLCPGDTEDLFLGYVTPNKLFHLCVPPSALGGKEMAQEVRALVGERLGTDGAGPTVGEIPVDDPEDDDWEEEL